MLKGSLVALITPFHEDGSLDIDSFRKLVAWQIEQGSNGLVVCGTTGESSSLSPAEQRELIVVAVQESSGRVPVIAGTGTNDTRTSIERTLQAKEAGADACLVIFPYYNRPTFEGCLIHFEKVAECGLPVIVYYNPGRTCGRFSTKELVELCELPGIVGLKDCSGDINHSLEFMKLSSKLFFSGDDALFFPLLLAGAHGGISVLGNLLPKEWSFFVKTAISGDLETAKSAYVGLVPLCEAMALETNPQCIKYAMSLGGRCSLSFRLPLLPPKDSTKEKIKNAYLNFAK